MTRSDGADVVIGGTFTSVKDLTAAIETFIDSWNERCEPFIWTKTADQIMPRASQATSLARIFHEAADPDRLDVVVERRG